MPEGPGLFVCYCGCYMMADVLEDQSFLLRNLTHAEGRALQDRVRRRLPLVKGQPKRVYKIALGKEFLDCPDAFVSTDGGRTFHLTIAEFDEREKAFLRRQAARGRNRRSKVARVMRVIEPPE